MERRHGRKHDGESLGGTERIPVRGHEEQNAGAQHEPAERQDEPHRPAKAAARGAPSHSRMRLARLGIQQSCFDPTGEGESQDGGMRLPVRGRGAP